MYAVVLSSGSLSGVQGMNFCEGRFISVVLNELLFESSIAGWCLEMVMVLMFAFSVFMLHS